MKKYSKIMIACVIIGLLVMLSLFAVNMGKRLQKSSYEMDYASFVEKYSAENNLETHLVYAVIHTESGFDPSAQSHLDAHGLMQITTDTFDWLQTKTGEKLDDDLLLDPETNIRYGCLFLGLLKKEFSSQQEILAAYHAGRGQVNLWLDDPKISSDGKTLNQIPFSDTAHYVHKVEKAKHMYDKYYNIENN